MNILGLLGAIALTSLTGCSQVNSGVKVLAQPKMAYGDTDNVNFDNTNGRYRITGNTNSANLASNRQQGNSRASLTLIFDNRVQTLIFNGDNAYDDIESTITNQNLTSYYYGFYDHYYRLGNLDDGYYSLLTRYYFVNPTAFKDIDNNITAGTYSIYDGTWYNLYINHMNQGYYGAWFSFYDISRLVANFGFDEIIDDVASFDGAFGHWFDLNDFDSGTTAYNEPQYHYGNTFFIEGNSSGLNYQSTLSFLSYVYCFVYLSGANLGEFASDSIVHSVSIDYQPSDSLTSYKTGYDDGSKYGYEDGYEKGYQNGATSGYVGGYNTGYNSGYNDGATAANNYTFGSLFAGIADTPVLIFRSLFNFDLFGVSALTVILTLFTALLVIFIAKKIIK